MLASQTQHLPEKTEKNVRPQLAIVSNLDQDTESYSDGLSDEPHRRLDDQYEYDITFFVACYNEQDNIALTLDNLRDTMSELSFSYEIIVIDDCSKDNSVGIVNDYIRTHTDASIRLIQNRRNRGLARNFVEGAFLAKGRFYKLVCGDNVDSKESLLATISQCGKADLIVPFHAQIEGRSFLRRLLSRNYTRVVNILNGHTLKYYNGCAIYHRSDIIRWHSRSSGFGFQAELVTRLLNEGATFVHVPITAYERQGGVSSALKIKNWISVSKSLARILFWRVRKGLSA